MNAGEIAAVAERNISGQTDLLTTLSLAIIGGLLAVIVRVKTHNASPGNTIIVISSRWLMWLSIIFAGLTVSMTFFIKGMLVEMAPQLFSVSYDLTRSFSKQTFDPAPVWALQSAAAIQFLAFGLSILFAIVFVLRNEG